MRTPISRILRILPAASILLSLCCAVTLATDYTISTNPDSTNYTLATGDSLTAGITATHSGSLTISGNSTLSTGQNSLTSTGSITGTAGTTLTKTGTGTWKITGANQNFGSNIELTEGTLHVTNRYAIGTVNVNIGPNATFDCNRLNSQNGSAVSDYVGTISGSGTFKLTSVGNWMTVNVTPTQYLETYMSGFTGTLWLSGTSNGTRFRIDSESDVAIVNQMKLIKIDGNGEFWSTRSATITTDFDLNGFGASDGTKRGAFRIDASMTYTGTISLSGNSSIGFCCASGSTATFKGPIVTNGNTLQLGITIGQTGASQFCTYYLQGNVTSGTTLGTLEVPKTELANSNLGNVKLIIGDSTAATSAVTQTINANLKNSGSSATEVHPITFQPGANRTIDVKGVISGEGGLTKTGAGTLLLSGANTYQGATAITAGTVKVTNKNALGTNSVSISDGATLIWNAPTSGSDLQLNLTNKITGTGILYFQNLGNFMTMDSTRPLSKYLSDFAGTLKIGSGTRLRLDQGANDAAGLTKMKEIIIEDKGQFWVQSNGVTIVPKIILGSNTWNGEATGGIRFSHTFAATGGLELSANSKIGFVYVSNGTAAFSGGLETNGHTLSFGSYNAESYGIVVFSGPISSGSATAPANYGNLQFAVTKTSTLKLTTDTRDGFAKTQNLNVNIAANAHNLVFEAAKDYTLQLNGTLTGSGTLTKNGEGTFIVTQASPNKSGTSTLNAGTTKITVAKGLGTGEISIGGNATLDWAVVNSNFDQNLNKISGTGTLYLNGNRNMMTTTAGSALKNTLSGFKGTLKIGSNTRFRLDQGTNDSVVLNQLKEIIVEPGGQFWLNKQSYELSTKITLAGKGWKEEETTYGAAGAMRLTNDFKTTGALELAGDTELCLYGPCTVNYAGGTELNGHNLLIYGKEKSPEGAVVAGTVIFGGPITSTGGELGTIQLTHNKSNLKFNTIPGETKTQELDANINVGSQPITFVADAGYTLQLNGTLTATGTVTKEGAGTFIFADSQTLKTLTVKEGSLLVSEGATLKTDSMTLSPNALINLTLSSESPSTANLEFTGTLTSSALGGEIALSKELGSTIDYGDSFLLVTAGSMTDEEFTKLNFASSNDSVIDYPGGRWSYSLQSLGTGVGIYATALDANAVPEPSTWILLAFGILGLLKYRVIQESGKH